MSAEYLRGALLHPNGLDHRHGRHVPGLLRGADLRVGGESSKTEQTDIEVMAIDKHSPAITRHSISDLPHLHFPLGHRHQWGRLGRRTLLHDLPKSGSRARRSSRHPLLPGNNNRRLHVHHGSRRDYAGECRPSLGHHPPPPPPFQVYIHPPLKVFDDIFNNYRLYGSALLVCLGLIVFAGVKVVNKFALPLVVVVIFCIFSTFLGAFARFNGSDSLQ